MVTHTWANLFVHLVAACVADGLNVEEYDQVANKLAHGEVSALRDELYARGTLRRRYWICAFCVNQHAGICAGVPPAPEDASDEDYARWDRGRRDSASGQVYPTCECQEPKYFNDTPDECEMNKFDDMMMLLREEVPGFRQVVAVDSQFSIFERIWCVAEMVAAHFDGIPQDVRLETNSVLDIEADDLTIYRKLATLTVADCQAARPQDKADILAKIPSIAEFDAQLQATIFSDRGLLARQFVGFALLDAAARTARRVVLVRSSSLKSSASSLWRSEDGQI
eukprot:TRINITY_DN12804_c0_g1_i1.p1 TRINITY_DN12804_c0_g1~~TRINITY_DN12804_c0_g1_i1.p1  ORF type:complete len:281 (-),score=66.04 TRINITY_DN12804_c0_g1_i1:78-920(-)